MAKLLVPDEFWAKVEPLVPLVRGAGTRGRPPNRPPSPEAALDEISES
jgi:hypothetical protein